MQPGDTVGKIAKRFKTSVQKIGADNKLKQPDKIFPGQRLSINGSSPSATPQPTANSREGQGKGVRVPVKPERSKESQGHPLAIIPSDQKRAPWMEVAVREAKQWGSKNEKVITKTDNYHNEIGLSGNLASTPWCASFVNYCLKDSNYPHEKSASSQFPIRSKKFTKLDNPVYGCIAVFRNPVPKKDAQGNIYYLGHVGFIYGKTNGGDLILLGGNQGNSISFNPVGKVYLELLKYKPMGYFIPTTYIAYAESVLKNSGDLANYDLKDLRNAFRQTQTTSKETR